MSEEVAARVREWPAVTVIVDGVAYIPLRTDWMPPKVCKTADGVAVLLDSRTWPDEVRQAVAARKVVRVSGRVVGEFWKAIQASAPAEKNRVQGFREYLKESLEVAMTEVLPEDWIQRVSNYPQPHEPGPWETPQGYRMMWDAEAQKIVFEHRYIYEKHHGAIPPGHVIHHINGVKNDNRIENLRMITPSEHIRLHAELRRLSREHNEVSEISPVNAGEKVTGAAAASALSVGRDPCKVARCDLNGEQSEAPPVPAERVASGDVQMGAGPALHIGAGEEGGVLPGEDASCCGDLSALQDMDQQVSCPTPSADQVAPAESGITDEVIESVFPLDQIAKMGAAMALKMLEDYRERHPHLGILETPDLVLMGHDDLTALLTRAVTDPQVVAEARGRKAKLDEMLAAQQREARRPKIIMNDKVLNEKTSEAIGALQVMNEPPRLFIRAGRLVRVEHDEHNRPAIQTLNKAAVRGELDRAAHWVVYKPDKDKEMVESYVTPGEAIAEDLMERPSSEWGLPPLIGIATSPILHLDGSIHDAAGYDPLTRMYLLPEPGFVLAPVPASPTSEDIEAAKALLLEPFWDFPFVDEASRWNAVGALMTGVLRPIIEGPCPCWLLTKPQAGSGASLMQCAVYSAITGSDPPASVTPKTKEEWEKRALSILMGGAPVHIWDNLEGSFRSDVLASLLTAREWRGRRLGQTEEVSVPARTVWFANGNNVQIGGDLARRVYLSRIDAEVALPWMREDFRHPDLLTWVRENRGRLIAAALTLGVAWVQAGCPEPEKVPPLGGYEGWRHVVGGVLEHAGATQFMGNAMEVFLEADTDLRQWEGFLSAVYDVWGSNSWSVADLKARMEGETSAVTAFPVRVNEVLPDDLADAFTDPRRSFSRSCGRALARQEGRRFPSGLMIKRGKAVQRATQWVIVQTMAGGDDE